ncbi:MAG: L,D-transpeptidase [Candidatus Aminicenantes bacterium]|nr:L,D-transpeptidase [Candidatus Aminicenantes bacterium]
MLLGFLLISFACKTAPVPPEAQQVENLEQALWRAGASFYAEQSYERFKADLKSGREKLAQEKAKFGWFRDYSSLQAHFRDLLQKGDELLAQIETLKGSKAEFYTHQTADLAGRVVRLKRMTDYFNENGPVRKSLSQAEIKLSETETLLRKEQFGSVGESLAVVEGCIREAERSMTDILSRYLDKREMDKWRTWADETVADSRKNGTVAFLVNKLERKLTVYKKGAVLARFDIGLGRYGLSDKLYSGDEATPEGKYRITRKYPDSPFHKALLINYPNEDDKRTYALAKKNGLIPAKAGIGGYIEIHGGGKDNLTTGCVGLENKDMDEIYKWAEVGTAVTIVGAVSIENTILAEIKKFEKHD